MTVKVNIFGSERNITASKDVLAYLSIALCRVSDYEESKGYTRLSVDYLQVGSVIHDALDEKGYFEHT